MEILIHRRNRLPDHTLGELYVEGTRFCHTLEPGSASGKGPIPPGRYALQWCWSNHFQRQMPYLMEVPGFTGIMIHPGNSQKDTRGCILVGNLPQDGQGCLLQNSRKTFFLLEEILLQSQTPIRICISDCTD